MKKNNQNITFKLVSRLKSIHSLSQSEKVPEEHILPKYNEELALPVGRPGGACCHGRPQ